jgi:hypothetical protein
MARKGDIFIKFNFMEVKVMRGFTIAIMLVVAFMVGSTQLIVAEEVKAEEKAKVESEVASETEIVLTPEEFEKCRDDILRPLCRLPWCFAKRSHWARSYSRQDESQRIKKAQRIYMVWDRWWYAWLGKNGYYYQ